MFCSNRRAVYAFFIPILCLLAAGGLFSCGRKSNVKPPEESAPGPVIFPRLEARSNSLVLLWLPPKETAGGDEIIGDLRYEILRRSVGREAFQRFEEIAVIVPDPDVERAPNQSLEYEDIDIVHGKQYEYLIVPRDSYGYEGIPAVRLRATFIGAASVVETLPFYEDDDDEEDVQ
jgi:hypothetical protein